MSLHIRNECYRIFVEQHKTLDAVEYTFNDMLIQGKTNALCNGIKADTIEQITIPTSVNQVIREIISYYDRHGALNWLYSYLSVRREWDD